MTLKAKTVTLFSEEAPLVLASGASLSRVPIAYQTFGRLNHEKSNAVLICHALTGDQFVTGPHGLTGKPGWWARMVGPHKIIDTERYFVICSNILGGCMGSLGPASINPETNLPYGPDFPVVTLKDMVAAQQALLDLLGIDTLFAVIGGSMGGMQVLEWLAQAPQRVFSSVCIASAARHTAQNIAFHEIGRQAVMADPKWAQGRYSADDPPRAGLAVARMTAHVTYLSQAALTAKFDRNLQDRDNLSYAFDADFQVESYLRHQGSSFVERFDPNSYLYITRAMDYFDLAGEHGGDLTAAFKDAAHVRSTVISFTSDWLYPTQESKHIVRAMAGAGMPVSFAEMESDAGHDAFLLNEPEMDDLMHHVLRESGRARGLEI